MRVIKYSFLLALWIISTLCVAQTVQFGYDSAGNRTSRTLVFAESKVATNTTANVSSNQAKDTATLEPIEYVNEPIATKVLIYPNPTTGLLKIELTGYDSKSLVRINVYNLYGATVLHEEQNSNAILLNLSDLPVGTYVLDLKIGEKESKWKIVKK